MRFCEPGRHYVLDGDAQLLRHDDAGRRVYACHPCVRDEGLVPAATFIGHRDTAPTAVRGSA